MLQHQSNSPQCQRGGQHVNLRLGAPPAEPLQTHRFFHGTTWENALNIQRNGFLPSANGCLGRGIYVAREDKATRFAQQHVAGGNYGGLVELLVTFRNPKYVIVNDISWQDQGYDACRAERTTASTNMEWCIKSPSQIEVLSITPIIS